MLPVLKRRHLRRYLRQFAQLRLHDVIWKSNVWEMMAIFELSEAESTFALLVYRLRLCVCSCAVFEGFLESITVYFRTGEVSSEDRV